MAQQWWNYLCSEKEMMCNFIFAAVVTQKAHTAILNSINNNYATYGTLTIVLFWHGGMVVFGFGWH